MKKYNLAILRGDGVGSEIISEAMKVLDALCVVEDYDINYNEYQIGGSAIDNFGEPLPKETIEGVLASDAILLGAIGGPKWENLEKAKRPEAGLLKLREMLGAYLNIRPIKVFDALADASPLKIDIVKGVDMVIVRELTGGIYFGQPREKTKDRAFNTMVYTRSEIKRIAIKAFEIAKSRNKKLCSVDKANVLEVSELWREVVCEVGEDYDDVSLSHMYVDNAAMQLVRNPKSFDVILTSNLFGDILSDEAGMISGSIGVLPSSSRGDGIGLYEPIHGSAPDIANQGIANPIATILSLAMLLEESFGEKESAKKIILAVDKTLQDGYRTQDIAMGDYKEVISTEEMGSIIAGHIYK